jgi:hypothetical protein
MTDIATSGSDAATTILRPGWGGEVNATVKTLLSLGGLYALAALAARPWMEVWGATGDERRRPLSGDELVADANEQTHAITIDAAPAAVWPWQCKWAKAVPASTATIASSASSAPRSGRQEQK